MTRTASFSRSRACFSKRGAQHIPSLTIWLSYCTGTGNLSLPRRAVPLRIHSTWSISTGALDLCHLYSSSATSLCLAGERATQKNGSWCRMSGWMLFKVESLLKSRFGQEKKAHGRTAAKEDLFINALTTFCLFHGIGFGCKIILI